MESIRTRQVQIRGKKWTISLFTCKDYEALNGIDSMAITDGQKKTINFQSSHISIELVRHELFHAYMAESYLSGTEINAGDFEEVAAEVVAEFLPEISRKSRLILKWLSGR